MSYLLFSLVQFDRNMVQQTTHRLLAIQHIPRLLIALNVVLNFLLKLLIDPLILQDAEETLVDLTVKELVLVGQLQMVLPQILALHSGLVQLTFAHPD